MAASFAEGRAPGGNGTSRCRTKALSSASTAVVPLKSKRPLQVGHLNRVREHLLGYVAFTYLGRTAQRQAAPRSLPGEQTLKGGAGLSVVRHRPNRQRRKRFRPGEGGAARCSIQTFGFGLCEALSEQGQAPEDQMSAFGSVGGTVEVARSREDTRDVPGAVAYVQQTKALSLIARRINPKA